MAPTVKDNPDASRFQIFQGEDLAGYAEYRRSKGQISFTHTEVDKAFEGQGIGSALARGVLGTARDEGWEVLPFCEFLAGYINKHRDDYLDLVPEERRAEFEL